MGLNSHHNQAAGPEAISSTPSPPLSTESLRNFGPRGTILGGGTIDTL